MRGPGGPVITGASRWAGPQCDGRLRARRALDVVRRSRSAAKRIVEQGDPEPAESCRVGNDGVFGDPVLAEREGEGYDQPPTRGYDDAVDEWLSATAARRPNTTLPSPLRPLRGSLPACREAARPGLPGGSHRVPGPRCRRGARPAGKHGRAATAGLIPLAAGSVPRQTFCRARRHRTVPSANPGLPPGARQAR